MLLCGIIFKLRAAINPEFYQAKRKISDVIAISHWLRRTKVGIDQFFAARRRAQEAHQAARWEKKTPIEKRHALARAMGYRDYGYHSVEHAHLRNRLRDVLPE